MLLTGLLFQSIFADHVRKFTTGDMDVNNAGSKSVVET